MAKKKHYEYRETSSYENREFSEKARSHKLKPNDRWRYNPKEVYNSLDEDEDYDDNEEYTNWK